MMDFTFSLSALLMFLSFSMPDPPSLHFGRKSARIFIICFLSGCHPSLRTASSLVKEARGDSGIRVRGGGQSWPPSVHSVLGVCLVIIFRIPNVNGFS